MINNYNRLIGPDHQLEDSSFRNSALSYFNTFCQDSSTVLFLYNAMFEVLLLVLQRVNFTKEIQKNDHFMDIFQ